MNKKLHFSKPYWPILLLIGGYISIAIFLGGVLHFNYLQSDVLGYWQDSLNWKAPFHPFHVPAYPLAIALLRGITFGIPSALTLMMSINIFAFLFSALLIHKIIVIDTNNEELAVLAVVLFGFWPLVGLPYAVDPLADLPAMFLFLVGLYLLLRSHRLWAALFFGFSLITHKAMWIFVGILILVDWFYQKNRFEKQNILFFGILFMPLGLLWLSGSFYHGSPLWLFSSNLKVEITSKSTLPILDGLLGTILGGGIKGTIKGGILTVFACISALSALLCLRLRPKNFQYGLAISLAIFILFLF